MNRNANDGDWVASDSTQSNPREAIDDLTLEQVRASTPGCRQGAHLNNAGAGLLSERTLNTVVGHLQLEAEQGGYEAAIARAEDVENTYRSLARLVGGDRPGIALFDNSTRAWNAAFYSLPLKPGDRILTSRAEYTSNIAALWHRASRVGCEVVVVPDDADGDLDVEALEDLLDERVVAVAVTWVPTGSGLINDVVKVGARVARTDALYFLDATQAVGQLDINVAQIGCDVLTGTGRKFLRGPRGTGFSWTGARALERLEPHVVDVASTSWDGGTGFTWAGGARRFETWEISVANVLGLGAAVDQALELGIPKVERRALMLSDLLRAQLGDLPRVTVHDRGRRLGSIVTVTVEGLDCDEVVRSLAASRITVNATAAEQNQLDVVAGGTHPVVRLSPHYYNTVDELDRTVAAIGLLARRA